MGELNQRQLDQKARHERRNKDIMREYNKLKDVREHGKRKHSEEWVIAKVAYQFYLSEKTIESIIYKK